MADLAPGDQQQGKVLALEKLVAPDNHPELG
jgi:hypothetical protein